MKPAMPAAEQISAIAFDLDGTLVDSAPDIAAALGAALQAAGLGTFDLASVRRWIGDGPDVLIARALEALGLADASPALRMELRRAFDTHTLAAPLAHGMVFPGIHDLLHALHGVLPMVVVTNKPGALARAVLEDAKLLHFVADVQGAETAAQRKPAPAMLRAAAEGLGLPCASLLMVGDSLLDLEAARNAGCPAAIVAWGYGSEAIPLDAHAWRIQTPRQLQEMLLSTRQRSATH